MALACADPVVLDGEALLVVDGDDMVELGPGEGKLLRAVARSSVSIGTQPLASSVMPIRSG